MKGILCASLLILLMPSVAYAAALPGDSADGKRLHDASCIGCHDTGIYTRKDRLVGSLDALSRPHRYRGLPSHYRRQENDPSAAHVDDVQKVVICGRAAISAWT